METRKNIYIAIFVITTIIASCLAVYFKIDGDKKAVQVVDNTNQVKTEVVSSVPEVTTQIIEQESKYIPLSVSDANVKIGNPNLNYKDVYVVKTMLGNAIELKNGKVEFVSGIDSQSAKELGFISDESEFKVRKNFAYEVSGFTKKVIDVEIGCYTQDQKGVYFVFLMEDGTVEYATLKHLVTNLSSQGKVENLSNIQRLVRCNTSVSPVIALDKDNNLYDINYILFNR